GLLFGQSERVYLNTVPEPPERGILDAIAFGRDLVPQLDECPHLAQFGDEADACIDEEADATDHGGEPVGFHLSRGAHAIEYRTRVCKREGELLHRRRTCLLQMIRAHVHRV